MSTREFLDGDIVLARYIPAAVAWNDGLAFFSSDNDYIQVGTWAYNSGRHLQEHIHNVVPRETARTQEVVFVKRGSLVAHIYGMQLNKIGDVTMTEGDIVVLLAGGHSYDILVDGTQVLEIKNGPYPGADVDRTRFTPR